MTNLTGIAEYGFEVVARSPAGESVSEDKRMFNWLVSRIKAVGLKPEDAEVDDDQEKSFSGMCAVETEAYPVVFSLVRDSYNHAGTMLFVGNGIDHNPTFVDYIYVRPAKSKAEEGFKEIKAAVTAAAKHHLGIIGEAKQGLNKEAEGLIELEGFFKKLERF
jgi:hypothetical protein